MRKYYNISLLFWIVLTIGLLNLGDSKTISHNKTAFPYILQKDYNGVSDICVKFFEINLETDCFNYCCDIINYIGNTLGFSYPQMNIIIFVIVLPLIIINLIIVSILQFLEIKRLSRGL